MSQPPYPYNRIFDFESFSIVNPTTQQPGVQIEGELDAIKRTLDSVMSRLSEIQRDDGYIRDSALDESTIIPYFYNSLFTLFEPVFLQKEGGEMDLNSVIYWAQNTLSPVGENGETDSVTNSLSLNGVISEEFKLVDGQAEPIFDWEGGKFNDVRTSRVMQGKVELTHGCVGLYAEFPAEFTDMGRLTISAGKSVNAGVFPWFDNIDSQPHIQMWDKTYGTITIKPYGITFSDGTEQVTRGLSLSEVQYEAQSAANSAIASLVGSAPAVLDTLSEIAEAINNDANIASTLNASIATKLGSSEAASIYYPLTNPAGYITSGALSSYLTVSAADAAYYPLSNPSGYITSSSLSGYLTTSAAASTYFPIPTGNTSQYIAGNGSVVNFPTVFTANKTIATVYNQTGVTLTKGTAVYINGAHGNLPTVAKAQANAESTSSGTYGFVSDDIPNASNGTVVLNGVVENLNTSSYVDGNVLYLSPTVAGGWTTAKPVAPNHMVTLGVVTRAHPSQGTVQLRIANGFELDEIHDVLLTSKTNNDLLAYESSTGLWKNKSYATLGIQTVSGMTPYLQSSTAASTYYPLSNPSGYITSSYLDGYALKSGTDLIQVTGNIIKSMDSSDNFVQLNQTTLQFGNGTTVSGLTVDGSQITFADSTIQTTAGIGDAPSDSQTYGRLNGAWSVVGGGSPSWGSITGTLSAQTDLDSALSAKYDASNPSGFINSSALSGYLLSSTASSTYQTLSGMSSYLTTSSAASTYAPLARAIPSGGTAGQVLSKVDSTNYNLQWTTVSGGSGGGIDVQTFGTSTTSGTFTWTKPANAKYVEIYLVAAGGGGGSGGRYATTSGRSGGGAGAGGSVMYTKINASYLSSTESVVVGAGSSGGAAQANDNFSGNTASVGGTTSFSLYRAIGGAGGTGGTTTGGTAGANHQSAFFWSITTQGGGGTGTTSTGTTATNIQGIMAVPGGGGGGGGAAANVTSGTSGGNGSSLSTSTLNAGAINTILGGSGGSAGVPATNGTASSVHFVCGTGGGGGNYINNFAAGAGGNGGWPGGGGGGGGASNNGFLSGAGGNGANGFAVIITYT